MCVVDAITSSKMISLERLPKQVDLFLLHYIELDEKQELPSSILSIIYKHVSSYDTIQTLYGIKNFTLKLF